MIPQALSEGPHRESQDFRSPGQVPGGLAHGPPQQLGLGGAGYGLQHPIQASGLRPRQAEGRGEAQCQIRKRPNGVPFGKEERPAH